MFENLYDGNIFSLPAFQHDLFKLFVVVVPSNLCVCVLFSRALHFCNNKFTNKMGDVETIIKNNVIVVFSSSGCPYCREAINALRGSSVVLVVFWNVCYWLFYDKERVKPSKLSKPPVRSEIFYCRKQDLLRFQTYGWKENMSVVAMTVQVTLVCQMSNQQ